MAWTKRQNFGNMIKYSETIERMLDLHLVQSIREHVVMEKL